PVYHRSFPSFFASMSRASSEKHIPGVRKAVRAAATMTTRRCSYLIALMTSSFNVDPDYWSDGVLEYCIENPLLQHSNTPFRSSLCSDTIDHSPAEFFRGRVST